MAHFEKLFEPGQIGRLTLKNRLVMAPMITSFNTDTGAVSEKQIAYYVERAKGGVGMIIVEGTRVEHRLGGRCGRLTIANNNFIAPHWDLVNAVHEEGAKIALQLNHTGRVTNPDDMVPEAETQVPVAPSPVELSAHPTYRILRSQVQPRALTIEEIEELIEKFADAAVRARRAGYDAVEVHGGHGYLIHQFMSPRSNVRTDRYGGSIENRVRFPVEIIKRVKEKAGGDFSVIFRLSAFEDPEHGGGITLEDAIIHAKYAEAAGADALHVSAGSWEDRDGVSLIVPPISYPQGWNISRVAAIKKEVKTPIIAVSVIREPEFTEAILQEGKADFIALGRALIADPQWPNKAAEGRVEDIRKCSSCMYCNWSMERIGRVRCAINAVVGREREWGEIKPTLRKKRVMIVGAGPGGMEAARVASLRGHEVILYDKEQALGGGVLSLSYAPPHKEKMKWVKDYLVTQINKSNVSVHLGTEVTSEIVEAVKPDALILATGARPRKIDIPRINNEIVVHSNDVLSGKVNIQEEEVVILGGWSVGCETADFLTDKGNRVSVIEHFPASTLARGIIAAARPDIMRRLASKGVTFLPGHDVEDITPSEVVVVNSKGKKRTLHVNRVVIALGAEPLRDLLEQVRGKVPEIYAIGDCVEPRTIADAIREGSFVARRV